MNQMEFSVENVRAKAELETSWSLLDSIASSYPRLEAVSTKSGFENWKLERNKEGKILSVENRDSASLNLEPVKTARISLFSELDSLAKTNPQGAKDILNEIQKLEKAFELSTDPLLKQFPCTLAHRFNHASSLLKAGFEPSSISKMLSSPLSPALNAYDSSGKFDANLKPNTFAESDKHLYYRNPSDSPRANAESARTAEIWRSELSQDNESGKAVMSVSKNGQRIENWLINKDKTDSSKWQVSPLEAPDPQPDKEGLKKARNELFSAIGNSALSQDEKMEFVRDITQIEHRARQSEFGNSIAETRLELAKTYKQIERLLTNNENNIDRTLKLTVARQLARELGDPSDIDQGVSSDACRIVAAQYRLACRQPSVVATVVADAFLEGKVRFGTPKQELALDARNRQPSSKESTSFPRPSDERSFASQLFQIAAMNALGTDFQIVKEHLYFTEKWKKEGATYNVPNHSKLVFVQTAETRRASDKAGKTEQPSRKENGMLVFGIGADNAKPVLLNDGRRVDGSTQLLLQACSSQKVLDLFAPQAHKNAVFAHKDMDLYTRQGARDQNDGRGMVLFKDEAELIDAVKTAKKNGNLPIIIASRDYTAGPGEQLKDVEECLDSCHSNHSKIIRDYVPEHKTADGKIVPEHLVCDDFFGKSYDRKILTRKEWANYFMNSPFKIPAK